MGVDSCAHRAPILILLHVQLLLLLIIMKVSVNMLFKNWCLLKVEKNFKPRPHNRILVPASKLKTKTPVFFMRESPKLMYYVKSREY